MTAFATPLWIPVVAVCLFLLAVVLWFPSSIPPWGSTAILKWLPVVLTGVAVLGLLIDTVRGGFATPASPTTWLGRLAALIFLIFARAGKGFSGSSSLPLIHRVLDPFVFLGWAGVAFVVLRLAVGLVA